MILDGFLPVFLFGAFGGIIGELMRWYRLREKRIPPYYLKSPFYWIITFLIIISGGILATLYGINKVNALLATNIGLSAPLIIQNISRSFIEHSAKRKTPVGIHKNNIDKLEEYIGINNKLSIIKLLAE